VKTLDEGNLAYNSKVASTYESDRESEEHWNLEHAFIEDYFINNPSKSILDIPIGTGRFLSLYPNGAEIIGIDISPAMLDETRKNLRINKSNQVHLMEGDATNLHQIPARSVDMIICFRLLHLVQDETRRVILDEFARVLRGRLLLQVYISDASTRSKKSLIHRKLSSSLRLARSILQLVSPTKSKPWCHIQSYKLGMATLEKLLKQTNLMATRKNFLCRYLNEDVYVIEIVHSNHAHD